MIKYVALVGEGDEPDRVVGPFNSYAEADGWIVNTWRNRPELSGCVMILQEPA